ncbi:uncharacterized protein [Venturia canescens]|uniref:uncharacterized protein isoform X3 n=1 Tax=Venturia canescens TaxID=32260 RepID=UPI001C9C6362|nr:uncharacterized protein LOC122415452 isoform X3 [Venturia canescens]
MVSRAGLEYNRGCWELDKQAKAPYKGLEAEGDEKIRFYSCWDQTPDILLEEIFSYLTMRERYNASLVCKSWYRAFHLQRVWDKFILEDTTLTRGKFNYYSGWQYVLDHMRTSACLNKVGKNFRSLVFEPMLNFYNLYEFMNMVSWYTEKQGCDNLSVAGVGTHIRHLKFTFPCNMANRDDPERVRLFGTGGKLLEALKRLTRNLTSLNCLEFIDLMLDNKEALHLLDDVCSNCGQTLYKLVLINATRFYCPLIHIGVFLNLKVLVVSPQNIDGDVLELLGHTKLEHLHIYQNRYSPMDATIQLPQSFAWEKMRKHNPHLKVHFAVECNKTTHTILPIDLVADSCIPCYSIVLNNPTMQVVFKEFTHSVINMIRDKISTATILQIATTAKALRFLYVRRNVVLKRFDRNWADNSDWTNERYQWMKIHCRSYERTEQEVSKILGYRWHMLSEKEFKNQLIGLHI